MEVLVFLGIAIIFWASEIGKRNGVRFHLFENGQDFGATFLIPFGALFLSGGGILLIIALPMLYYGIKWTYLITSEQTVTKFEFLMLFLGKIMLVTLTFGLAIIAGALLGQHKAEKR